MSKITTAVLFSKFDKQNNTGAAAAENVNQYGLSTDTQYLDTNSQEEIKEKHESKRISITAKRNLKQIKCIYQKYKEQNQM